MRLPFSPLDSPAQPEGGLPPDDVEYDGNIWSKSGGVMVAVSPHGGSACLVGAPISCLLSPKPMSDINPARRNIAPFPELRDVQEMAAQQPADMRTHLVGNEATLHFQE